MNPNQKSASIATVHSCRDLGVYINGTFTPNLNFQTPVNRSGSLFLMQRSFKELSPQYFNLIYGAQACLAYLIRNVDHVKGFPQNS